MPRHQTRPGRLAAALVALAASLAPRAGAAEDGPAFETLTVAGPGPIGRLVAVGVDAIEVAPADGPPRKLPTAELVRASRDWERMTGEGGLLILPDGDRLAGARIGPATDAAIEVEAASVGAASVPVDAVLGLILAPPTDPEALDRLARRVRTEPRTSEVAWLGNGDRVSGSFLGLDDRSLRLEVQGAPRELPRDGVVALGFDPALVAYPKPEGPFLEVGLADGTRLGLSAVELGRDGLSGTTRFGAKFRADLEDVVSVAPRTPAIEYLSGREPDGKSYVPYFDLVRPFQADANVDGLPMVLKGRRFERGLGTQSRTLLAYKVQPGDLRFQATVGVDERAGPLGSVAFRVLADGKPRFASEPLTARDEPVAVDVDLEGVKLLILATEFGERGDVRDLADWAEARIVRRP